MFLHYQHVKHVQKLVSLDSISINFLSINQLYKQNTMHTPRVEDIETLLDKRIVKAPSLICGLGNNITRYCCNEFCIYDSLCCGEETCKVCLRRHKSCQIKLINELTSKIDERLFLQKKIFGSFFMIQNQLMTLLSASRNAVVEKSCFWKIGGNLSNVIEAIYFKGNGKGVKGKDIKSLISQLTEKSKCIQAEQYLLKFKKQGERMIKELVAFREKLIDSLLIGSKVKVDQKKLLKTKSSTDMQANSNKAINEGEMGGTSKTIKLRENSRMLSRVTSVNKLKMSLFLDPKMSLNMEPISDFRLTQRKSTQVNVQNDSKVKQKMNVMVDPRNPSKILQEDFECNQKFAFLMKELEYPSLLKLLFRASEHHFEASKFHHYCNNISKTLTIVRTQFGKTIAAYTPLKWSSTGGFVADNSKKSFLLNFQLKERIVLVEPHFAIYNSQSSGPTFGKGFDFYISDKCNKSENVKSECNFPMSYDYSCKNKTQKTGNNLIGALNAKNFIVLQYEVFQIIL